MIKPKATRSRRLRKKLRVGEFQELGFEVSFAFAKPHSPDEEDRFWDEFTLEAIEANGLMFGGNAQGGFVAACGRASATERHRAEVQAWLDARPEIVDAIVGHLIDAWH